MQVYALQLTKYKNIFSNEYVFMLPFFINDSMTRYEYKLKKSKKHC